MGGSGEEALDSFSCPRVYFLSKSRELDDQCPFSQKVTDPKAGLVPPPSHQQHVLYWDSQLLLRRWQITTLPSKRGTSLPISSHMGTKDGYSHKKHPYVAHPTTADTWQHDSGTQLLTAQLQKPVCHILLKSEGTEDL